MEKKVKWGRGGKLEIHQALTTCELVPWSANHQASLGSCPVNE